MKQKQGLNRKLTPIVEEQPKIEFSEKKVVNFQVRNMLNYNSIDVKRHEPGGGKSKTIPDQSLTIKELIQRSQRGYPLDASYTTFYNGEDDTLPDLRKLDLTELHELRDWTNSKIKDGEKFIKEQYEKAQAKDTEEYYRKKFAKEAEEKTPALKDNPPQRGGDSDTIK